MNNIPIKSPGARKVKIKNKTHNITPGIQKALTNKTYKSAKSLNDNEKLVFRESLQNTGYYSRKLTKRKPSGLDKYIKNELDKDVKKNLDLDTKPKLKGKELRNLLFHLT